MSRGWNVPVHARSGLPVRDAAGAVVRAVFAAPADVPAPVADAARGVSADPGIDVGDAAFAHPMTAVAAFAAVGSAVGFCRIRDAGVAAGRCAVETAAGAAIAVLALPSSLLF